MTELQGPLWSRIDKTDSCWLWRGPTRSGYGRVKLNGATRTAHRVVYELLVGPIPDGLQLDHLCRVRNCVNPEHLDPVSARENTLRGNGVAAVHARKTHCSKGHLFDEKNTHRIYGTWRQCRTCNNEYSRIKRLEKRNNV